MVLGQSTATAAVQAIDRKVSVQEVNVKAVQNKLVEDPLVNGSTPEILVDNDDKDLVVIQGAWKKEVNGGYAFSFLHSSTENANTAQSVKFNPVIKKTGQYKVFVYFPRINGAASKVATRIQAGNEVQEVVVRPNEMKVEGQTSGEWISVGKYTFSSGNGNALEVSTDKADGIVVADAVLFIPVEK